LEVRIKEVLKTIKRADNLMAHVGVAMGYLCGDLVIGKPNRKYAVKTRVGIQDYQGTGG
jgi:hypothetical protein